jgi:demethylmenaquinone methyltransferase/2-methoxy-6-polyprenyl-1,4-benzoquinol methylase
VYQRNSPHSIQNLFASIASSYDRTNNILSLGMHLLWNRALVRSLDAKPTDYFLDLCAGTGAITACYIKAVRPQTSVSLVDFCKPMLNQARLRLKRFNYISYVVADACHLPLPNNKFQRIAMAYGLRNIKNPQLALNEAYRVLDDEGLLVILELTRPKIFLLRYIHKFWLRYVLPKLGKWISQNEQAYDYLQNSIHSFKEPYEIIDLLRKSGFNQVTHRALHGQIASLFIARKTVESA